MKTRIIISLAVVFCSAINGFGASEDLPAQSAELLRKLNAFKLAQAIESEQAIDAASKATFAILKKHQDRESENGNLDAAVALKAIKSLDKGSGPPSGIPADSKAAILKYQAQVKTIGKKIAENIAGKKIAVARVLKQHEIEQTKKKNLEAALAVRAELKKLPAIPKPSDKPTPTRRPGFEPKPNVRGTLAKLVGNAGGLEVVKTKPQPLLPDVEYPGKKRSSKFFNVPAKLVDAGARIHWPMDANGGVAEYKVTSDGYVAIICDYSYQGNNSGGWTETRWTADDFRDNGWKELSESQMGAQLIKSEKKPLVVFYKKLKAGEEGKLRCNKYGPPIFLTFSK